MSINQSTILFKCLIFYLRRRSLMKLSSHFLHHPRSARTLALEASSQGEVVTRKFGSLNSGDPLIVIDGLYFFACWWIRFLQSFSHWLSSWCAGFFSFPASCVGSWRFFRFSLPATKSCWHTLARKGTFSKTGSWKTTAFERCRRWWSSSKASILRAYERRECLAWVFSLDLGTFDSTKLPRSS